MKENPKFNGKAKHPRGKTSSKSAAEVEPTTVPKTIYDIINNKLTMFRPITRYDGNQCINILMHKDEWLPAFDHHPLSRQIKSKWNSLHDILHIAASVHAQKQLDDLQAALNQYASLQTSYFAAGLRNNGGTVHTDAEAATARSTPRWNGRNVYTAYLLHAKAANHAQRPAPAPATTHASRPDTATMIAYEEALAKFPLIEYTWKFYDHAALCHIVSQINEAGNLLAGSSWFIEAGNSAWKATLQHHTSGGGGLAGDASNKILQAFKRMWSKTHPLIREHSIINQEPKYKQTCTACGLLRAGHVCKRPKGAAPTAAGT
jgi:hypothetical protein